MINIGGHIHECVQCRCLQWCKCKHILNTENTFGLYFTYYCSPFRLIDLLWFVYSVRSTRSQSAPNTISDPSINNTEKMDICALHIYMENCWIWIFQMNRNVCGSATEAYKVFHDCQFADLESMDGSNHYFHELNDWMKVRRSKWNPIRWMNQKSHAKVISRI